MPNVKGSSTGVDFLFLAFLPPAPADVTSLGISAEDNMAVVGCLDGHVAILDLQSRTVRCLAALPDTGVAYRNRTLEVGITTHLCCPTPSLSTWTSICITVVSLVVSLLLCLPPSFLPLISATCHLPFVSMETSRFYSIDPLSLLPTLSGSSSDPYPTRRRLELPSSLQDSRELFGDREGRRCDGKRRRRRGDEQ